MRIGIKIRVQGDGLRLMNMRWWAHTRKEWVPILLEDNKSFWSLQTDPTTGRPWQQLDPEYAAWKQEHFGSEPILEETGTLFDTARITYRKNKFRVQTTPYGVFLQEGTKKMVARPWMGVPQNSVDKLPEISLRHILSRKR